MCITGLADKQRIFRSQEHAKATQHYRPRSSNPSASPINTALRRDVYLQGVATRKKPLLFIAYSRSAKTQVQLACMLWQSRLTWCRPAQMLEMHARLRMSSRKCRTCMNAPSLLYACLLLVQNPAESLAPCKQPKQPLSFIDKIRLWMWLPYLARPWVLPL